MNRQEIEKTLDDSLSDNDFFCCETRRRLKEQGLADEESLIRLAILKSKKGYARNSNWIFYYETKSFL